ncbi:MAG: phosphodiester glycosidase family protein [Blastocatellia bacterium]
MRQNSYSLIDSLDILKFVRHTQLVAFLCALCVLCGSTSAQDFKKIHDGVEYAQVQHKIGDDPVKINLLRLDLTKVRLDVHHALDKAIGIETTSSIAKRKSAVAAINAGFFRLDKSEFAGDATDSLMLDGELVSEGNHGRIALLLANEKKRTLISIDHTNLTAWLGSSDSRFTIRLTGVNRPKTEREMVLYTASFGPSTPTSQPSTEIVLDRCERGKKSWRNLVYCKDVSVHDHSTSISIPRNGYVISISKDTFRDKELLLNELNVFLSLSLRNKSLFIKAEDLNNKLTKFIENIDVVSGVPQLINDGKIDITWELEKASKSFVETRHPRTAVAKMKDGKFLMVTVDGRQPGVSVGMNLNELAEYLLGLGAVDAMNLDGGGSTTMFLDGQVVNTPSDKEGERKVGDAILVTLRKNKSGK